MWGDVVLWGRPHQDQDTQEGVEKKTENSGETTRSEEAHETQTEVSEEIPSAVVEHAVPTRAFLEEVMP